MQKRREVNQKIVGINANGGVVYIPHSLDPVVNYLQTQFKSWMAPLSPYCALKIILKAEKGKKKSGVISLLSFLQSLAVTIGRS